MIMPLEASASTTSGTMWVIHYEEPEYSERTDLEYWYTLKKLSLIRVQWKRSVATRRKSPRDLDQTRRHLFGTYERFLLNSFVTAENATAQQVQLTGGSLPPWAEVLTEKTVEEADSLWTSTWSQATIRDIEQSSRLFFAVFAEMFSEKTRRDIMAPARQKINSLANRSIANAADAILDKLTNALTKIDTSKFPPVRAFEAEDGSLLIEWIFPHWRCGFSIEPDQEASGWFLVSDNTAGGVHAWGLLSNVNTKWLVNWILEAGP
jgi:hypothetical protein